MAEIKDLNVYQDAALTFRTESANGDYALYNLAGEVGEILSLKAKAIRDGRKHDFDENMKKELGDVLWHVAAVAADHGYTLSDIANGNIYKLASRAARGVIQGSGDNR